MICEDGDRPTGWSPDGKSLLLMTGGPKIVNLLDVASRKARPYLDAPGWDFRHAKCSPDGHWVAFIASHEGSVRPCIVPYVEDSAPKPGEWVQATDQQVADSDVDWSPDGRLIYFLVRENGKVSL